jgi:hypothetical protein
MEVTAEHVAKVPAQNLHVSREEFGVVWARAEVEVKRHSGPDGQYLVGVVWTCRWLADQPVPRPEGGREVPRSPVSWRQVRATPERIEDEYYLAVRRRRSHVPRQAAEARGALATLAWAWHSGGRSPLDVAELAAG